ncbi:phosphatidate cytidylyltransferase [Roseitranquillus sediminis]|uniref:phosphatidate cytidylyltransferase n=1 Tax=Roseitranquillus sediminis TaxID=2809051 RepID=UPI001D0C833D|nr:phosphatidate cytidylyltransferase [Roseitranquillus sediminis]MBM9595640.1 phosphatidate cytidylyltransferase [Roseitranquillus sediminis]
MTPAPGRWEDLNTRLATSAVIAVFGLLAVWIGGWIFVALVAVVCAVLTWELVQMLKAGSRMALPLAGLAAGVILLGEFLPPGFALPFLLAPAMVGIGQLERNRTVFAVFTTLILVAGYGLLVLRTGFGFYWMLWLVSVVIVTDVGGYFAGRWLGGPKFWPRVSPKKTWSGTVAGWIAAAIVGAVFVAIFGGSTQLIGVSIAISMASQLGDIAESAVKRRMGVKDSSTLLPGHGGLFDRFDGMLGASIFFLLVEQLVVFPPLAY